MAGLPDVRHDHAPAMAKFAQGCLDKFQELVRLLEAELGLGTADLMLRTGLHSGPVTGRLICHSGTIKICFQAPPNNVLFVAKIEAGVLR